MAAQLMATKRAGFYVGFYYELNGPPVSLPVPLSPVISTLLGRLGNLVYNPEDPFHQTGFADDIPRIIFFL